MILRASRFTRAHETPHISQPQLGGSEPSRLSFKTLLVFMQMDDGACQALAMSCRRTACAARRSKVAIGFPDHTAGSEINRFRVLRPPVSPCHSMESSRYRERGSSVHAARPGEFPLAASAADWCGVDPCVDAGHASDEQLWIDTSGRGYVRADNRHAGCHDEYWCVKESIFKTACYE